MTKPKLNLIFLILLLTLIFLAVYSGFEFSKSPSETMEWQSVKFSFNIKARLFGIGIILSVLGYIILRRKISTTN